MIQPNRVDVRQQGAHPIDAPAKAGSPMGLPVVHGVAPKLSLGAEVVGRHAGYETWVVVIIEQEQLGVGPNIARIRRNEKGQIANQADALGMRVFLEPFALPEQQELSEADLLDSVRQLTAGPSQCCRDTLNQLCRPLEVICAVVLQLQRAEQDCNRPANAPRRGGTHRKRPANPGGPRV